VNNQLKNGLECLLYSEVVSEVVSMLKPKKLNMSRSLYWRYYSRRFR